MEMNELVRDICMTLHISRATLYRYINTGRGNA
jgi:predicted transcriptional regulator YheO